MCPPVVQHTALANERVYSLSPRWAPVQAQAFKVIYLLQWSDRVILVQNSIAFLEGKRMAQTLTASGSFYCRVAPESFESASNMSNRLALPQGQTIQNCFAPIHSNAKYPSGSLGRPCHSLMRIKKHDVAMIHLIQYHSARPQRIPHRSLPVIFAVERSKRSASNTLSPNNYIHSPKT